MQTDVIVLAKLSMLVCMLYCFRLHATSCPRIQVSTLYCAASDCSLLRAPKQASIRPIHSFHVLDVMGKAAVSPNDALLAPGTPPKHRSRSHSPVRKPWISAEWKHRVPKSSDKTSSPSYLQQLQTEHRVELEVQHKKQLAAEFSIAQDTIQRMLDRCQLVQDTLHVNRTKQHTASSPQLSSSSGSSSRHLQPSTPPTGPASAPYSKQQGAHMYLTNRSQLLFQAPSSASAQGISSSSAGAPDRVQQQDRQQGWVGCVDLNPGFAFRPGTPERTAAVLRHGQQSVQLGNTHTASPTVASVQAAMSPAAAQASAAAFAPGRCCLTHREQLQAGIQEQNAAFYAKIRQQQWQQHQQQIQQLGAKADVVPVSWFGA